MGAGAHGLLQEKEHSLAAESQTRCGELTLVPCAARAGGKSCYVLRNTHLATRIVDLSQSVQQLRSVRQDDMLDCILPGSKWWLPKLQRPLSGREALLCHGYPWPLHPQKLHKCSDNLLCDLAGNAFSGTVILSLMNACLLELPWEG